MQACEYVYYPDIIPTVIAFYDSSFYAIVTAEVLTAALFFELKIAFLLVHHVSCMLYLLIYYLYK